METYGCETVFYRSQSAQKDTHTDEISAAPWKLPCFGILLLFLSFDLTGRLSAEVVNELELGAWEVAQCVFSPSQLPLSTATDHSVYNYIRRL